MERSLNPLAPPGWTMDFPRAPLHDVSWLCLAPAISQFDAGEMMSFLSILRVMTLNRVLANPYLFFELPLSRKLN